MQRGACLRRDALQGIVGERMVVPAPGAENPAPVVAALVSWLPDSKQNELGASLAACEHHFPVTCMAVQRGAGSDCVHCVIFPALKLAVPESFLYAHFQLGSVAEHPL